MRKCVVIGMGVSGASCAYKLNQEGYHTELFDKGRRFGGRTSSKEIQGYLFNFVSSLLLNSAEVSILLDQFPVLNQTLSQENQHLNPYTKFKSLEHLEDSFGSFDKDLYSSEESMNQLCYQLIQKIPSTSYHPSFHVLSLNKEIDGWWVEGTKWGEGQQSKGPFDEIVLSLPAPQLAPLLIKFRPDWSEYALKTQYQSQWSVSLLFDDQLQVPFERIKFTADPILESMQIGLPISTELSSNLSSLPNKQAWCFHLNTQYSKIHLEKSPQEMVDLLLDYMQTHLSPLPVLTEFHAHRWRYSRFEPNTLIQSTSLFDSALSLGVCGDWIVGSSISKSMQSGLHLAKQMIGQLT